MTWNHKIKKSNYYKTEHWINRREEMLEESDGCEECNSHKNLQVHHKHYNSLFKEKDSDLMVLCKNCHQELHNKVFDIESDDDE